MEERLAQIEKTKDASVSALRSSGKDGVQLRSTRLAAFWRLTCKRVLSEIITFSITTLILAGVGMLGAYIALHLAGAFSGRQMGNTITLSDPDKQIRSKPL